MHSDSSAAPLSDAAAVDTLMLAADLQTASFHLGIAEAALRHAAVPHQLASETAGMQALTFLNDCLMKSAAIHHGLMQIAAELKDAHSVSTAEQADAAAASSSQL